MRVLFFNPEQYVTFENEPSNYELRLPIINCGIVASHEDFNYQRVLKEAGRREMNRRALRLALDYEPDLLVYSTTTMDDHLIDGRIYKSVDSRVLRKILKHGIPLYIHVWDTFVNRRPRELEWFLNCRYFGVADSVTNYLYYRSKLPHSRARAVIFTAGHNVFTDVIHKKPLEKTCDVTLLGSNEGLRMELIPYLKSNLADRGITLHKFGGLIDNMKTERSGELRLTDRWVPWDEYVNIINRSKICLSSQTQPSRCQVKGKIFDVLACGTLCVSDGNPQVRRIVPEDCIVYYENAEDCLDKIAYYLEHEDERARIADAGHQWFHRTFDYKKFWSGFLTTAANGDATPPALPCLERAFDDFRREGSRRASRFELIPVNPLKRLLVQQRLRATVDRLASKRWVVLDPVRKAIGDRIYEAARSAWRSLRTGVASVVGRFAS